MKYGVTLRVRCKVKATSFIDDIPYQYLKFSVKMEVYIVLRTRRAAEKSQILYDFIAVLFKYTKYD